MVMNAGTTGRVWTESHGTILGAFQRPFDHDSLHWPEVKSSLKKSICVLFPPPCISRHTCPLTEEMLCLEEKQDRMRKGAGK